MSEGQTAKQSNNYDKKIMPTKHHEMAKVAHMYFFIDFTSHDGELIGFRSEEDLVKYIRKHKSHLPASSINSYFANEDFVIIKGTKQEVGVTRQDLEITLTEPTTNEGEAP